VASLIAARAVQGLAGAVMIPQGFALVKVVFPPDRLRAALIPFGPIMGLGTVAGPILAGWLLHLDLFGSQWRAIFLVNVPIGLLAVILGWFLLPKHSGEDPNLRVDLGGVALLTLASLLLIVPLVEGREFGWPAWSFVMIGAALVATALFARWERRSRHPVLPPSLFARRSFVVGLVITGAFFASFTGFQLAANLLFQLGLGWSPLNTGFALIPWALGTAVAIGLSGAVLAAKFGRSSMQVGLGVAAAGLLALWWILDHATGQFTAWTAAPALFVIGFGSGLVFVPSFDYILGDATVDEAGAGSGMLNAVQQFANAIGFAALGTLFFARASVGGVAAIFSAAKLVILVAAALYVVTLLLVGLLPKHIGVSESGADATSR
jgi:predicted MFS family arabinose efflux permease